ncbi:MAG TPA: extracellular solute-binding protein, partial [Chloroflexota bacterium]
MSSTGSAPPLNGHGQRVLGRRRLLRSIGALAGSAAALGLAACGQAPAPTPTPAAKPAAAAAATAAPAASKEQIKLTWWNNQPMARTKGLWEAVVGDIEAANPNVKIETVIIPFDDFEPKIMAGLAGKNLGDLVDVHPVHAFTFAMRGALVDLNPYMKDLGIPDADFTPAWKYNFWKGKYWAVPRSDNPTVFLYNKKMTLEAGLPDPYELYKQGKWDLAAVDKMMQGLSKGEGDKRVYGSTPLGANTLRLQCVWIWGAGGDIWNPDET